MTRLRGARVLGSSMSSQQCHSEIESGATGSWYVPLKEGLYY